MKGAMSSQKVPLGFENETMEFLEKQKKIMFPDEVLQICPRGTYINYVGLHMLEIFDPLPLLMYTSSLNSLHNIVPN